MADSDAEGLLDGGDCGDLAYDGILQCTRQAIRSETKQSCSYSRQIMQLLMTIYIGKHCGI